jgi:putative ATPase
LESRAQALAELERPKVLVGDLKSLPKLLGRGDSAEICFDAAVGRNALYREPDKAGCLNALSAVLRPGGQISLAEVVPSQGMHLSELLNLKSEDEAFCGKLTKAEEKIYADPDNPLVNWSVGDLCGIVENAGFNILKRETQRFADRRTIRNEDIERWFAAQNGSYADRASTVLNSTELERLRKICTDQLTGMELDWRSTVLFLSARKVKD